MLQPPSTTARAGEHGRDGVRFMNMAGPPEGHQKIVWLSALPPCSYTSDLHVFFGLFVLFYGALFCLSGGERIDLTHYTCSNKKLQLCSQADISGHPQAHGTTTCTRISSPREATC